MSNSNTNLEKILVIEIKFFTVRFLIKVHPRGWWNETAKDYCYRSRAGGCRGNFRST